MAILQKLNSKANLRKTSGGDLPYQTSYPVIARYEADSTASQTLINMTFSVDQANKESFQLFIDGKLLREGSSNDFTFTSIQADNTSSQITLNAPIDANLNIVAIKLGLRVDSLSSGSSAVSSGGSKNYFSLNNANPDFEKNVTSPWLPCTLTWSGTAPSGAPTLTATNMTLSVSNSNPLIGSYSMLLTKAPVNSQYQGLISSGLTIDREDVAKVLYGSFSYELVSGTVDFSGTSTQTYEIWIWNYDPANPSVGQWIQPAGYRGMNQSSGVGKVVFSFQTDGTFTNNAYKIAIITQQTGTGAIVVKFDDFLLGPQAIVTGTTVTDWQSFTPTGGWTTNTSYAGKWRRVGDTAEIEYYVTLTGSPNAANLSLNLPSGMVIDTSKLPYGTTSTSSNQLMGMGQAFKAGTGYNLQSYVSSSTSIILCYQSSLSASQSTVTNTQPISWGNGDYLTFFYKAPIAGWSANVQTSSDTDTRVVAASYYGNANYNTVSGAAIPATNVSYDTHSAITLASGRFTAPISGYYDVMLNGFAKQATIGNTITLYRNNIGYTNLFAFNVASHTHSGAVGVYLNAGEYIDIRTDGAYVLLSGYNISVARRSGPSVITATETVAAKYYCSGSQSIPSNTAINFDQKSFDTHNMVSTGAAWTATAPISGKYLVSCYIYTSGFPSTASWNVTLYKGVSISNVLNEFTVSAGSRGSLNGSTIISLTAGETIYIKTNVGAGTPTLDNSAGAGVYNYIQIVRVGN